jgi:hypothetical protein
MAHAPLGYMVFLRGVVGVIMSLVYCNLNGLPLQNSYHQVSVPPQSPHAPCRRLAFDGTAAAARSARLVVPMPMQHPS